MAYETYLPDTSQQLKMAGTADNLLAIPARLAQYRALGKNALNDYFQQAQANIGAQFAPTMRLASARLAANPLLGDSGYANRLNRQIQTAAFGDLSRQYGTAAAEQSQGELGMLQNLLQQRYGLLSGMYGSAQKKQKFGDYLGSVAGSLGGAALGGWGSSGFSRGRGDQ